MVSPDEPRTMTLTRTDEGRHLKGIYSLPMEENIYVDHTNIFEPLYDLAENRDAVFTVDLSGYPHRYPGQIPGRDKSPDEVIDEYILRLRTMARVHLKREIEIQPREENAGKNVYTFDVWVSGVTKGK